jgi:hypothetical protein
MKDTTKELLTELIRNKFDSINLEQEYITHTGECLIDAATDLGLTELAQDMQKDMP